MGVYPYVGLADARKARENAKVLLAKEPPIDPMVHKKEVRRKAKNQIDNTFEVVAREWYHVKNNQWSYKYGHTLMRRLEMNVFPILGNSL